MIAFDPAQDVARARREHGIEIGSMEEVMARADVVVATTGPPGLIKPSMIRRGQVILALSNPDPEIAPEAGRASRRGVRRRRAQRQQRTRISGDLPRRAAGGRLEDHREMKLAAAQAIAELAPEDEIVPNALDQGVHDAVAEAVREAAMRSGVARPELATVGLMKRLGSAAMDFARLDRGELIAIGGGSCSAVSLFLAWYSLGNRYATLNSCRGPNSTCTGWESLTILRFLLLITAVAPPILAWIIVRGHALSWPRGELTAVTALAALTFTVFRGVIDSRGHPRARSASLSAGG